MVDVWRTHVETWGVFKNCITEKSIRDQRLTIVLATWFSPARTRVTMVEKTTARTSNLSNLQTLQGGPLINVLIPEASLEMHYVTYSG